MADVDPVAVDRGGAGGARGIIFYRRAKLPPGECGSRKLRAAGIWLLQSMLAALVLFLLWQPAITISELKPQQDIIVVLVDDSRSMALAENGTTRQTQAIDALRGGVLAGSRETISDAPLSLRQPAHADRRPEGA